MHMCAGAHACACFHGGLSRSWVSSSNLFVCLFVCVLKVCGHTGATTFTGGRKTAFRGPFFPPSRWVKASLVSIVLRRVLRESWLEIVSAILLFRPQDWWDDRWMSPHWALFKCWVQGLLFSSGPLAELSLWPHIVSSVPESLMEPGAHQFCWNGCPARHTDPPVTSSQC